MSNLFYRIAGNKWKRLVDTVSPGDPVGAPSPMAEHVMATIVGQDGVPVSSLPTEDNWTPSVVADVTDNDSDKTLTVPASTEWQPLSLHVTLVTTATVGDRQLAVLFTTPADVVLAEVRPQTVQAASLTRSYSFGLGNPDDLAFYDTDLLRTPLPLLVLPAGYKIRVYDNNAVAAAADDMAVQLMVVAR